MKIKPTIFLFHFLFYFSSLVAAEVSEVTLPSEAVVCVRENIQTGEPYISLAANRNAEPKYAFQKEHAVYSRPDYRLLSDQIKRGEIPYDGPISDRKKIYILAGSLAATGIIAAATVPAAAGVATAGTGAGGAAGFFAGSTAVATGSIWTAIQKSKPNPNRDAVIHTSQVKVISWEGKK